MSGNAEGEIKNKSFPSSWIRRSFIQIAVMAGCFCLYYLGLFGGVEGPLSPASLAERLNRWGVTRQHLVAFFLMLTVCGMTWNWFYNMISFMFGRRFICGKPEESKKGARCEAPARRRSRIDKKTGDRTCYYECTQGHSRPSADFNPVMKGVWGGLAWIILLAMTVIIFIS